MTFGGRWSADRVRKFDGTRGERAANRLTHAWRQVPNPIRYVPIPASAVHTMTDAEIRKATTPALETLPRCSTCGEWGASNAADWPCGAAPRSTS